MMDSHSKASSIDISTNPSDSTSMLPCVITTVISKGHVSEQGGVSEFVSPIPSGCIGNAGRIISSAIFAIHSINVWMVSNCFGFSKWTLNLTSSAECHSHARFSATIRSESLQYRIHLAGMSYKRLNQRKKQNTFIEEKENAYGYQCKGVTLQYSPIEDR